MQAQYALKVQAIRSKKQKPRLYVYLPAALAEAISMEPGEDVRWELLGRGELHLVRERVPALRAKHRAER
jgi:antitoxin component of MazEF toxin-antitoxin module